MRRLGSGGGRPSRRGGAVRLLACLLGIALPLGLVACGDDDDDTAAEGQTTAPDDDAAPPEERALSVIGLPPEFVDMVPVAQTDCYEEQGITVDLTSGIPEAINSVISGAADIGTAGTDQPFRAIAAGEDLTVVAGLGRRGDIFVVNLMSLADRADEFNSVEDIVGTRIGMVTATGQSTLAWSQVLEMEGLPPDSVEFVEVGPLPNAISALIAGTVDLAWTNPAFFELTAPVDVRNEVTEVLRVTDYQPPNWDRSNAAVFVRSDWLDDEANADALRRMLEAHACGLEAILDDPEAAAAQWAQASDVIEENATNLLVDVISDEQWTIALSEEGVNDILDEMEEVEGLGAEEREAILQAIDRSYLPEPYASDT